MNKKSKKTLKIAAFSFLAMATLVACGKDEVAEQHEYVEPVYEEEAVFVKKYDKKHIDVLVGETKKMYTVPSDLEEKVGEIKKDDVILITYSLDHELKRNIKGIDVVGENKKEDKKVEKKEVKKEKKETKSETSLKVYLDGKWDEQEASIEETDNGYTLVVLEGYESQGNKIVLKENNNYSVMIEELSMGEDIKPLRWNASSLLKKIGDLKELFNENIYDPNFRDTSEFVFTAKNNEIQQIVVVRKEENHLMRYTMTFPSNDTGRKVEASLWAMMEGLQYN